MHLSRLNHEFSDVHECVCLWRARTCEKWQTWDTFLRPPVYNFTSPSRWILEETLAKTGDWAEVKMGRLHPQRCITLTLAQLPEKFQCDKGQNTDVVVLAMIQFSCVWKHLPFKNPLVGGIIDLLRDNHAYMQVNTGLINRNKYFPAPWDVAVLPLSQWESRLLSRLLRNKYREVWIMNWRLVVSINHADPEFGWRPLKISLVILKLFLPSHQNSNLLQPFMTK